VRICFKRPDGGKTSGVFFYGIEWKALFSIGFLYFSPGGRESLHSHAFNAITWWLFGMVLEYSPNYRRPRVWRPSWRPKRTPRSLMHRVEAAPSGAWAFTIRGPWVDTWLERRGGRTVRLTHGRKEVKS
jgi:hypothetical protein